MEEYSGLQALFLSFWSSSLYRSVAKEWQEVGYLYLLAVICLTTFFTALQIQVVAVPEMERIILSLTNQLPAITIEKGVFSMDKASPYTIIEPKSGKALITFDTASNSLSLDEHPDRKQEPVLIVTKTNLYSFKSRGNYLPNEIQTYSLASIDHFKISAANLQPEVSFYCRWIGVLVFIILVPLGFIFCAIQTLLYALIGKIFCRMATVELPYSTLIRLSAVALTPALLFESIQKAARAQLPSWHLFSIVLTLGYLYFGIISNRPVEAKSIPANTET